MNNRTFHNINVSNGFGCRAGPLDLLKLRLEGVLEDIKGTLKGDNGIELDAEHYTQFDNCAYALDVFLRWLSERSTLIEACDV